MLCAYCGRVCIYPDDFPVRIHAKCKTCIEICVGNTPDENVWWRKLLRWIKR